MWGVVRERSGLSGWIAHDAELEAYRACQARAVPVVRLIGTAVEEAYRALVYELQDYGDLLQAMQE